MKTILVPIDFSEAAGNAAEYAVNLANEMDARVILLHVFHFPLAVVPDTSYMVISYDDLYRLNENLLKEEVDRLMKKTGVVVKYQAKMGLAVDEILAEQVNADFIVMGMKGAGQLSETIIGSVTTSVLRKATTPVLVIPEKTIYKTPGKIVFACDYSKVADTDILKPLKELSKELNSEIIIVNVRSEHDLVSLEESVNGVKLENALGDVQHVYYFPENKDVVESINEFVDEHQAGMIAIIPHHYSLWEGLFHKSISKKMAFHSHVPVLVLAGS